MLTPAQLEVLKTGTNKDVETVLYGRNLSDYVKAAWKYVVPDPLVWGWHMDAICEHLMAVSSGQIENLLINVPFGCSKTILTSILWPTWEWAERPEGRWMYFSYDQMLSTEASTSCRRLVETPWYQEHWPVKITTDQNQKTYFENENKGWRLASSVTGHGLGRHPDRIVIDDPQDPKMAASEVQRLSVLEWWKGTITSRGAWRGVRKVIIMQRLHEDDLSNHVIRHEEGWEHLMLPMRMEGGRRCSTSIGFVDRRENGEILDLKRFPEEKLAKIEAKLGPHNAASQLQQRPSPARGGLIKRSWFRCWVPQGQMDAIAPYVDGHGNVYPQREIPATFDQELLSLDCNKLREAEDIRKKADADPVSLGAWGRSGPDSYLLERTNARLDLNETCDALEAMAERHPRATAKVIEYAANGPYVMALLRKRVPGLIPVTPEGSKEYRVLSAAKNDRERDARAVSMQVMFKSGNVWLPHPNMPGCEWVLDYIEELCGFPTAPHDDDVDMTSQALAHLQGAVWLHQRREKQAELDAKPLELNPKKHHEAKIGKSIKDVLKRYEKEQQQEANW